MSAGGWGRAQRLAGPHDQDFSPLSPTANMDEYMPRTYGTGTLDNRPLFGETSTRDRFVNLAVGGFTSLLVIIFWYREGDLEPKFRNLIYYTIGSIILLCLCANLYFHNVGR